MKAGLEVHQQLAVGKLFCACPSELSDCATSTITRRLHATGGEDHAIDRAAAFEAAKGRTFRYETTPTSCLVEVDEEPPRSLNSEALDVALTVALLLNARPLDEIEVMRKIVVDGSNTTGFQRTALIAVDGRLVVNGQTISIPTICLEEDAARKIEEGDAEVRYRLDRLGIPLIEIATGPELGSGEAARHAAEELGALLRATGRVRRGIGSIREDLNVSVPGGARVEIKGVQELRLIHKYVELEERRQQGFLELREKLDSQGAERPRDAPVELAGPLRSLENGPLATALRNGGAVVGLRLPGFGGCLGTKVATPERLGRELADYARTAGVRGIVHSDELPTPEIPASVALELRAILAPSPSDAFVLVAAPTPEEAREALERVRGRAAAALEGIPPETRDPRPDGTTRYSRPLPGRDRMYPETDVPPVAVTPALLARAERSRPEPPHALRARLESEYRLAPEIARQLVREGSAGRFEGLVRAGAFPDRAARVLTQDVPAIVAESPELEESITIDLLSELLQELERGTFAKEAIRTVLSDAVRHGSSIADAVRRAGLEPLSREDVERIVERLLAQNEALLRARGAEAVSPLMGDVMREVRGRRDGREVSDIVRRAVERRLQPSNRAAEQS